MATFKIVGFDQLKKTTKNTLQNTITNSGVLDEVAQDVIDDIQLQRTKAFFPLASTTVEARRRLARNNSTDPRFSPGRSNLTLTGQLVRSIKARIIKTRNIIVIEPSGNRVGYRNQDGTRRKLSRKANTNKKLADIHAKGGPNLPPRDILTIEPERIRKIVEKIRRVLNRAFS